MVKKVSKRNQGKRLHLKSKKADLKSKKEAEMAKHLEDSGWVRGENNPSVWKICMFYEDNVVCKTLYQAYKIQLKLDSASKKAKEGLVGVFEEDQASDI